MRKLVGLVVLIACCASHLFAQTTTRLTGRVFDARTGEPIAKVKINVAGSERSATTNDKGLFTLDNLTPGEVELSITTVGYALVKRRVNVGDNTSIEIPLSQEAATLTEEVTVTSPPFEPLETNAASEQTLNKSELAQLSSVLVRDPLRAAQALPSAIANDDFRSEFAVRGAGFDRVGVYLDDVLTDNFVYTVQNAQDTGSLSVINADTIESVALLSGAYPAQYFDSTAGVLVLTTREGNRIKPAVRVGVSLTNISGVVDGPFASKRGAYLFSARRSFVGYVSRRLQNEVDDTNPPPIVEFADVQGKAVYDFNQRHRIGVSAILGNFDLDINRSRETVGLNSIFKADSRNLLLNFSHTYTKSENFFLRTRLFGVRTNFANTNPEDIALDDGIRTQVGVRSDANYILRRAHRMEGGIYLRAIGAERSSARFQFPELVLQQSVFFDEDSFEQGYYLQDTYTNERLRFALTGGGRVEHSGRTGETTFSPRASLSLGFGEDYRVRAGFGRYVQFPDFARLYGIFGNENLQAERATHYNLSLERFIGKRTRVLAELYDREDRNLAFSLSEPRLQNNRVTFTQFPFRNSLNGSARGIELSIQRRSANNLSGWFAYAYSRARLRDEVTGLEFFSDFDQRHTTTTYGNYRLTETFSVSGQWRYGSGQPIPGFYRQDAQGRFFLASERNELRLPRYSRVDVRLSKVFLFDRFKLTVIGEVLNLLNRDNVRFTGFDGFNARGRVFGRLDRTLPILPSAGVTIEF